jgi:secreted Zn-dependent insulinase-like peptidase
MSKISRIQSRINRITNELDSASEIEREKIANAIKNEFISNNINLSEKDHEIFNNYISGDLKFSDFYDHISTYEWPFD